MLTDQEIFAATRRCIDMWNTLDLGYLTVYASRALHAGELKRGDCELRAGRLGKVEVSDDEVRLGAPFVFNRANKADARATPTCASRPNISDSIMRLRSRRCRAKTSRPFLRALPRSRTAFSGTTLRRSSRRLGL